MAYRLNRYQYARIYGTSPRSVSNYERDAAPLDDPAAMYHWFYSRRSQPAGIVNRTEAQVTADYAAIAAAGDDWERVNARTEMSDHLIEIDLARWRMRHWLKENGHLLRADAPARLEELSVNILAELAKLHDIPGGYDDAEDGAEAEDDQQGQAVENIVTLPTMAAS